MATQEPAFLAWGLGHQDPPMTSGTTVRWPVFLPLVLFFSGIGAAAAMTQLLGSF